MSIKSRIENWIINLICSKIAIGGHCGLCGKWIPDVLLPRYYSWSVCDECAQEGQEEMSQRADGAVEA